MLSVQVCASKQAFAHARVPCGTVREGFNAVSVTLLGFQQFPKLLFDTHVPIFDLWTSLLTCQASTTPSTIVAICLVYGIYTLLSSPWVS